MRLQADPGNMDLQQEEHLEYQAYRESSYLAEVYLQQKSKVTCLRLGDDNSKYFHSVIKHTRLHQSTTQLRDNKGDWQNDPDLIAQVFVNYYNVNAREK